MKFIDFIYFNIYSWYNKMKMDGRKVDPQLMTAIMFGMCAEGWLLLITSCYNHFKFPINLSDTYKLLSLLVMVISGGIINQFYQSNNRYLKVYDNYITSIVEKDKKKSVFLSFLFIFSPYLIFVAVALITLHFT